MITLDQLAVAVEAGLVEKIAALDREIEAAMATCDVKCASRRRPDLVAPEAYARKRELQRALADLYARGRP